MVVGPDAIAPGPRPFAAPPVPCTWGGRERRADRVGGLRRPPEADRRTAITLDNAEPTTDGTTDTTPTATEASGSNDIAGQVADDLSLAGSDATFADLGVRPETVAALAAQGITKPFAIQALTLPIALAGNDVIGQARTGTGKTLGFGIPLLERVDVTEDGGDGVPQALVVVPTRELCVQVAGDLERAGGARGVRVVAIYGGRAYEPQVETLRKGVEVVVGTPGRLLDLAQQRSLRLDKVRMLVLDEADEMLDLGFLPDVERIMAMTPAVGRQTMLFSATMPGPVVTLARRFLHHPVRVRAEQPDEGQTVPTTRQFIYRAHAMDKVEMLSRILQARGRGLAIVFCRTKRTAQKVADELVVRGFAAGSVHGDLGQGQREQALRAFRAGKVDVLVATDVAARGIDVTGVTHVINYQCPEDEKTYLHRIGRTGRAGGDGVAITFVDWDDLARWAMINRALDLPFTEVPEVYSSSEQLYSDLDIPEGTTGSLPKEKRTRAGLDAEGIEDIEGPGKKARQQRPRTEGGHTGSGSTGSSRRPSGERPGDAPSGDGAGSGSGRSRSRQRTRGNGVAAAAGAAESAAAVENPTAAVGDAPSEGDEPRRRRRRRGGRGGAGSTAAGGTGTATGDGADA
ncbi:MAG: box helicase domain protein [Mycobacterium sp.]|nr:box helicase domain protein [Mycobacterium sp.]